MSVSARSKQAAAASSSRRVNRVNRVKSFFAARLPLLLVDYVLREAHDDLRLLRRARQSADCVSIRSVQSGRRMRRTLTVSSGGSMSLELLPAEPGSVRCFFADGGIAELR